MIIKQSISNLSFTCTNLVTSKSVARQIVNIHKALHLFPCRWRSQFFSCRYVRSKYKVESVKCMLREPSYVTSHVLPTHCSKCLIVHFLHLPMSKTTLVHNYEKNIYSSLQTWNTHVQNCCNFYGLLRYWLRMYYFIWDNYNTRFYITI